MLTPLKTRVAIIGSGKLGTDLLLKVLKSKGLECSLFVGRNAQSLGILKAQSIGVNTSCDSVDAIIQNAENIDVVMDATSADHHRHHAPIFRQLGLKVIDLTPAKMGPFCIPSINSDIFFNSDNINLVTCGGQASIPLIHCLYAEGLHLNQVQVSSFLSSDSVGQGTLDNIDEYYSTTARAVREFARVDDVSIKLNIDKSNWKPDMLTTIRVWHEPCDQKDIFVALRKRLNQLRKYVPGYHIVGTPVVSNNCIGITVSIRGAGDWLPEHAGNLDIINCAAICIAEKFAEAKNFHFKAGQPLDGHINQNQFSNGLSGIA